MLSLSKKYSSRCDKILFGELSLPKHDIYSVDPNGDYSAYLKNNVQSSKLNIVPAGGLDRYLWDFSR